MGKCPVTGKTSGGGTSNKDWWPNQLNLKVLHQHSSKSNPMDDDFNYADEFNSLDLAELKNDIFIQCDSEGQKNRLIEILEEEDKNYNAVITVGALHNGFILNDINLHLVTDHEIFDRFKKKNYKGFHR